MVVTTSLGRCALAAGHVLDRRNDADQIELELQFDRGYERAEHARSAAHVELHLLHADAGLDRDAAAVEGDALADKRVGLVVFAAAAPLQHDQASADWPSPAHAEQPPMPSLRISRFVEHFAAHASYYPWPASAPARRCARALQMFGGRLPSSRAKRTPLAMQRVACQHGGGFGRSGEGERSESGVFGFSFGLNVAVYLYASASVARAAVRSFQAASLPGTSTSVR